MKHKTLDSISAILLLLGGLCIGLVGAFNFEPISMVLGGGNAMAPLARIVYVLIGLSAVYRLVGFCKCRSR